jgi:hypothetical protein
VQLELGQRMLALDVGAHGGHESDPPGAPPRHRRDDQPAGRIEPLQIVDGDEDG